LQNSIATRESVRDNKPEVALERWAKVELVLSKISVAELNYVSALRGAIAYGMCLIEARMGISSAERRARARGRSDPEDQRDLAAQDRALAPG
jgi:hypothetical protein